MTLQDKTVLLLDDQRVGNYKQIKAIASYLPRNFHIKEFKLEFNNWAKLPNFLQICNSIAVKNRQEIKSLDFTPDIILSCGRRSAPFALYLKKQFPKTKLVHLLKPNTSTKDFDLLITPKHDSFTKANFEYLLPPSLVDMKKFAAESEGFEYLKTVPEQKLCVIIGGSSKNKKLSQKEYDNFAKFMEFISHIKEQKILLTTSRRTDSALLDIINQATQDNHNIEAYLYRDNDDKNPYSAFLYYADKIIVTGDSISMVADSLLTKKPVMVYDDFAGAKQLAFLANLEAKNYILKFTPEVEEADFDKLVKYEINEAQEIAKQIVSL